jgi:hypothetical protein
VRRELLMFALASFATICVADDAQSPVPSAASAAQRAARPRQVAAGTRSTNLAPVTDSASGAAAGSGTTGGVANNATSASATNVIGTGTIAIGAAANGTTGDAANAAPGSPATPDPKFLSEAKWVLAGYNSDEIVYTVFVTNQEPRIIRCTTEVQGFYFENGTKLSISDRQITTVFPNQPTRVGYWMDMDQQSGASYSVKCHPV